MSLELSIDFDCPIPFKEGWSLFTFFSDPTAPQWNWRFSRAIVHESIHYWQIASSSYIMNLIEQEWNRLLSFEESNTIVEKCHTILNHTIELSECSFSNNDLLECWARFWEIQIQTPINLLTQENISHGKVFPAVLELIDPDSHFYKCPWLGIEIAMKEGVNNKVYGKPFRYLIERIAKATGVNSYSHDNFSFNNSNPSYASSIIFPLLAYESFQRDNPAQFFYDALDYLCKEGIVGLFNINYTSGSIELEWFYRFSRLNNAISKAPTTTKIITNNEIKSPYKNFSLELSKQFDLVSSTFLKPDRHPFEREAYNSIKKNGTNLIRIFLGFKPFMLSFSVCLPPPWISFNDYVKWTRELDQSAFSIKTKDDEAKAYSIWLGHIRRVKRFRNAEKAHSLGLSLDIFNTIEEIE